MVHNEVKLTKYNHTILLIALFSFFAIYCLIFDKVIDRVSASIIIILSISGIFAFQHDKTRWRKNSA